MLLLLLLFTDSFDVGAEAAPTVMPDVTRALVFDSVPPPWAEEDEQRPPPPLASDVARSFPIESAVAPMKPYDPAPLWLDRLAEALGARPNYIVRTPSLDLAPCDASDMRCQQFHDDHQRVDATDAPAAITASAIGTALGLMLGGKDRPLANHLRLRGKARFVGLVGEW